MAVLKVRCRITAVNPNRSVGLFIAPEDHKYCYAQYKDFLDRKIECDLVIQKHEETRTLPMNDLYQVITRKIAKETKNDHDQIKNYCKEKYGIYEKIVVPEKDKQGAIAMVEKYVQKSTAHYTIPEMCDIITGAFGLGADWGVDLSHEKKDYDDTKKTMNGAAT
jgi:hypothetical protein